MEDPAICRFPIAEALAKVVEDQELRPSMMTAIFLRRIDELGVPRARGDVGRFRRAFSDISLDSRVRLPISERRLRAAGVTVAQLQARLEEPITGDEIDVLGDLLQEALREASIRAMKFEARALGRYIAENGDDALNQHRERRRQFVAEVHDIWGDGLSRFEIMIGFAREVGDSAMDFVAASERHSEEPAKFEATFLLYGRACQISDEIAILLSNGFADGAQARWRSLHEIQVVLSLLGAGDEDLAERYLAHHDIDLYNEAKDSQSDISAEDLSHLLAVKRQLIEQYGPHFDAAYGWASKLLGHKATRFSDLEKLADAEYVRPFYRAASANVHASSRGTQYRLGLPYAQGELLTGASGHGLSHAAIGAARSLVPCAVTISQVANSPDGMAQAFAMQEMAARIEDVFMRSEQRAMKRINQICPA